MKVRTVIVVLGATALGGLLGLGVVGWWYAEDLIELRRVWRTAQPLTEVEQAQVAACEDPGWIGLAKVLEQDLEVACPPLWFAEAARGHLREGRRRRVERLVLVASDVQRSTRARVRAGTALWAISEPWPTALPLWLRRSEMGSSREALLEAAEARSELRELLDVELRWTLDQRLEEALGAPEGALVRALRVSSVLSGDEGVRVRSARIETGFQALGLTHEAWVESVARHQSGRPLGHLPLSLVEPIARHGQRCAEGVEPECALLLADLLEGPRSAPPDRALPRPLESYLDIAFEKMPSMRSAQRAYLWTVLEWLSEAQGPDRAVRLLASLTDGEVDLDRLAVGLASSPIDVLHHRTGSPFMVALTARALGMALELRVEAAATDGLVYLQVGSHVVALDACGRSRALQPDEAMPEVWPVESIFAQAMIEASGAALRRGEASRSRRLAELASSVDPLSAGGHDAAASSEGLKLSTVLAELWPQPGGGASTARAAWFEDQAGIWSPPEACPAFPAEPPEG
ncbi:MAG: hypothetical protein EA397_19975 [Deltaproteobacteria bacterium]|nr:MAG: hypothetical protein EA397_19975 [Deltaproteobacteria bacterium]